MLVLTVEKNKRVVLTGGIVVTVVDVRGDKARLGFEAPNDIDIVREDAISKVRKPHAQVKAQSEGETTK